MALASLSSHEVPLHDVRLLWGVLREQLGLLGSFFSLTPQIHTDILTQLLNTGPIMKEPMLSFSQTGQTQQKYLSAVYSVSCDRIMMK
jgi:hypothetical protein